MSTKHIRLWVPGVLVLLLCTASSGAAPIPIMVLNGESAGPYHAWKSITPVLKRELEETGLFQVDVVTAPRSSGGFASGGFAGFQPDFNKYRASSSTTMHPPGRLPSKTRSSATCGTAAEW
jgi:hypothetical protein